MFKKTFLTLFLLAFFACLHSQITIHPVPENMPHNDDYTVRVRVPGGGWQNLFEYQANIDMHNVQTTSMVNFDFSGTVEIAVKYNKGIIKTARIRPASSDIKHRISGNVLYFSLSKPENISVEINGDIFHNLQVFTNAPETYKPQPTDTDVIYIAPGFHKYPGDKINVSAGKTLYLAPGAVVNAEIVCDSVKNVRICGRGIVFQPDNGMSITFSSNISVSDIIFINPSHYTISGGQSNHIDINNIRTFSCKGWADGVDMMSCSDVVIDHVFIRTSDDCIALYGHRWKYYGDCRNIVVKNSTLWADVAHPIVMGTHGNPENPEVLEKMIFKNIDILNHDEPQINYQGCMAINVSDENLARDIRFEDIRIDDFERGQLVNLRVTFNKKYATAPGRGIENIYFKNITYNGKNAETSILEGYSADRCVRNIVFENFSINGELIHDKMKRPGYFQVTDMARFYSGVNVENLQFISNQEK